MKYKVNRNFADKYKGKPGERVSLNLRDCLYKRDYDNDLICIRDGRAQDIDGIISILLEYGVLEEADSEEDDSEEEDDSSHEYQVKSLLSAEPTSPWIDRVILQIKGEYSLYMFSAPAPEKRNAEGILSECLEHVREHNKKAKEDSEKKPQGFGLVKFMCDSIGLSIDDLRSKIESNIKEDSDKKDFEEVGKLAAGKLIDEAVDKVIRKIEIIKLGELLEGLQGSDESLSLKHEKEHKDLMELLLKRYK